MAYLADLAKNQSYRMCDLRPFVTDSLGNQLWPSSRWMTNYWQSHDLFTRPRGRPEAPIPETILDFVRTTYEEDPMGITKMYHTALLAEDNKEISAHFSYHTPQILR
jgi:hypothetical protein